MASIKPSKNLSNTHILTPFKSPSRNRFREILGIKEKEQILSYEEHAASAAGGADTGALYKV